MKPSSTVSNAMVSHGDQSEAMCPPICPPMINKTMTVVANQLPKEAWTPPARNKTVEEPKPSGSKSAKEKQPLFECLVDEETDRQCFGEEPECKSDGESDSDPGNSPLYYDNF